MASELIINHYPAEWAKNLGPSEIANLTGDSAREAREGYTRHIGWWGTPEQCLGFAAGSIRQSKGRWDERVRLETTYIIRTYSSHEAFMSGEMLREQRFTAAEVLASQEAAASDGKGGADKATD